MLLKLEKGEQLVLGPGWTCLSIAAEKSVILYRDVYRSKDLISCALVLDQLDSNYLKVQSKSIVAGLAQVEEYVLAIHYDLLADDWACHLLIDIYFDTQNTHKVGDFDAPRIPPEEIQAFRKALRSMVLASQINQFIAFVLSCFDSTLKPDHLPEELKRIVPYLLASKSCVPLKGLFPRLRR